MIDLVIIELEVEFMMLLMMIMSMMNADDDIVVQQQPLEVHSNSISFL